MLLLPCIPAKTVEKQESLIQLPPGTSGGNYYEYRTSDDTLFWDWNANGTLQFTITCNSIRKVYDFGNVSCGVGSMKLEGGSTWSIMWKNYNNCTIIGHEKTWIDNPNENDNGAVFWTVSFIVITLVILGVIITVEKYRRK